MDTLLVKAVNNGAERNKVSAAQHVTRSRDSGSVSTFLSRGVPFRQD